MIYLYSATPGTGKTCWVVKQLVDKWVGDSKYKNRKIYHNINGLKIEGLYPAPDNFCDCEDGSIIIYDEAQDIEYYSIESRINPVAKALSKHRHRGFDIHFITQDPALLNKWVLKNVYMHFYLWRPAQSSTVTVYTFARAIVSPTKADFKAAFDKRLWRFEPYYLQFYTSTVLNTSEKQPSSKRLSILATGFLFACLIAYFIRPLFSLADGPQGDTKTDLDTSFETTQTPFADDATTFYSDDPLLIEPRQEFVDPRAQELMEAYLPKDYTAIKSEPALQVRAVIHSNDRCKAYNAYGDQLLLDYDLCSHYAKEFGRVHHATEYAARTPTTAEPNSHNPDIMLQ